MRKRAILGAAVAASVILAAHGMSAWNTFTFSVIPADFDPYGTHLVEAEWEDGIGCPTNSSTAPFLPPDFSQVGTGTFTDPACQTGDLSDKRNAGLLLVKTGPTNNDVSADAVLDGVNGMSLTELGYDIRKPGSGTGANMPGDQNDARGSHCGAGAARFNIETYEDPTAIYFLGCNSPPPDMNSSGAGWQRLRWGGTFPLLAYRNGSALTVISGMTVKRLSIVFDEGQDTGPDLFGAAVLDNIDVNGTLVGRGPEKPEESDRDESTGEDKDHRHFEAHDSASRPESSGMSYQDQSQGVNIQMVNGARSIAYNGACVTLVGDALLNRDPGYVVTFAACDLSALSTPLTPSIGTYSVLLTGASGVAYQTSGALTSGFVSIHPH
jgi:hypothetical protein